MPTLTIDQQIQALIASFKVKAADGLTFDEFLQLLDEFTATTMDIVAVLSVPGEEKKAMVLAAVGTLFDTLVPAITLPLPFYLAWLAPILRPILRYVVVAVASALIEQLYTAKFKP